MSAHEKERERVRHREKEACEYKGELLMSL